MKKTFTLLLTLVASYCLGTAQHTENTPREATEKYFLTSIVSSDNFEDFHFRYDENNQFFARDRFLNGQRNTTDSLFYNDKGQLVRMDRWASFGSTAGEPIFEIRFQYEYDQDGRLSKRTLFMRPTFQTPTTITTFHYRPDGKLDYSNEISEIIGLDSKTVYSYNENGTISKSSLQEKSGDAYVEKAFTQFDYPEGKLLPSEILYSVISASTGKFKILKIDKYTYLGNSTLSYIAVNGVDTKVYRIDYNLKNTEEENRDIVAPLTPEDDYTFYRHGFDGDRISEKYSSYQGDATTYIRDKTYTYEKKVLAIETPESVKTSIKVYPNPATEGVFIEGVDLKQISLFNAKGEMVRNLFVEADLVNMGVASLPRGTYFVQVKSASGVASYPVLLR